MSENKVIARMFGYEITFDAYFNKYYILKRGVDFNTDKYLYPNLDEKLNCSGGWYESLEQVLKVLEKLTKMKGIK